MSATEKLRLYRRGAYVAEVLEAVENTLTVHPEDPTWFERADDEAKLSAIHRLQEVDDMAHATEARLALVPLPGGVR
jgi:hypothetical protein